MNRTPCKPFLIHYGYLTRKVPTIQWETMAEKTGTGIAASSWISENCTSDVSNIEWSSLRPLYPFLQQYTYRFHLTSFISEPLRVSPPRCEESDSFHLDGDCFIIYISIGIFLWNKTSLPLHIVHPHAVSPPSSPLFSKIGPLTAFRPISSTLIRYLVKLPLTHCVFNPQKRIIFFRIKWINKYSGQFSFCMCKKLSWVKIYLQQHELGYFCTDSDKSLTRLQRRLPHTQ